MLSHPRNNFDLIRLLAALQVVFNHAAGWLALPNLPYPYSSIVSCFPGVPIFFVVSGFLVTRSFLDCQCNVLAFGWRRALRIYPGLWVNLTLILILLVATGALPLWNLGEPRFWRWLIGTFVGGSELPGLLLGRAHFDWTGFYNQFPSSVLWTITVELGFYALTAVVFLAHRRRGLTLVFLALGAALSLYGAHMMMAWRTTDLEALKTAALTYSPAPYFWVFLIGAVMAYELERVRKVFIGKAAYWTALYAALCYADLKLFGNIVIDLLALGPLAIPRMLVLGCLVISFAYTLPQLSRPLHGVDLSYGIYLYHMLIIFTLRAAGFAEAAWLWLVVLAVPAAIAALSWFFVERPMLRLKKAPPPMLAALLGWAAPRLSALRTAGG
jgi:peptidoglycan/LPS O-acetylase OafA/YrhL